MLCIPAIIYLIADHFKIKFMNSDASSNINNNSERQKKIMQTQSVTEALNAILEELILLSSSIMNSLNLVEAKYIEETR